MTMRRISGVLVLGVGAILLSASAAPTTQSAALPASASAEAQFWAGVAYPNYTMPPLDAQFFTFDSLWNDWVTADADAHYLRHIQIFHTTVAKLSLSREQMQKLLPLVKTARARFGEFLDHSLLAHEKATAADRAFLCDDLAEDVMDKGPAKKKEAQGNFDKKVWDRMMAHVHGPMWAADENGGVDWKTKNKYDSEVRADLAQLDAAFTPEQLQLLAARDTGTGTLFWWGEERYFTPAFIVFSAPGADAWLAKQLGVAAEADAKLTEEHDKVIKVAILRRTFHRHYRMTGSPLHWVKGLHLSTAQLGLLVQTLREALPAHIAAIRQHGEKAHAYAEAAAKAVACLQAGKLVPADVEATMKANSGFVTFGYWDRCDIAPWRYPTESAEYKSAMLRGQSKVEGMLTEKQHLVLYDSAMCFIPWLTFTDPVNVGAPAMGTYDAGNPDIKALRGMNREQLSKAKEALIAKAMGEFVNKQKSRSAYPLLAGSTDQEQSRLSTVLDAACDLSDADYELNRKAVAQEFAGQERNDCITGYGLPNLSGFMPERDGKWPTIDWKSPEVQRKMSMKLSYYTFPTLLPVMEMRLALVRQFRPRVPTDLEQTARP